MSGTRKLEKFELERLALHQSGTQKLEKFVTPAARPINTPVAEPSPLVLAAARPSLVPVDALEVLVEASLIVSAPEPSDSERQLGLSPHSHGARAVDREPGVEKLRTRLARKFTSLADNVTEGFGDFAIGAGAWTVELTAPEGMSTSGGKQVLQYLRLRPKRQGHVVLVGGGVNPVTKTAELRDHEHMDLIYKARFGRTLEITAGEWEQFLRKAEVVLREEEITTTRVAAPREVRELSQRDASGTSKRTLAALALGVVVFLAAMVMWRVMVALSSP